MAKIANFFFIFFIFSSCYISNRPDVPYGKYADEISSAFIRDMKKKYGLVCAGSGGRMANGVDAFCIRFDAYRHATIEEAREMLVTAATMLVDRVNAHEKIRPYLNEYPFTWHGTDISIAFHNKRGNTRYYVDGSVALAHIGERVATHKGFLVYDRAELQMRKTPDFIDFDGTVKVGKVAEREVFVKILEETYEEALKIISEKKGSTK
ncbi:MAG: hypothetical protein K1X28_01455 [Parachlamydiales bacterium]|nr:hypothetical protein [Parachlamydiales bacterium]